MVGDEWPRGWIDANGTRMITAAVQRWVEVPEVVRSCGFPIGSRVSLHYSRRRVVIRGVRRCRNRFVCPDCSWHFRVALSERWGYVVAERVYRRRHPVFATFAVSYSRRGASGSCGG